MKRSLWVLAGFLCLSAGSILYASKAVAGETDDYIGSLPQEKIDAIEQNIVNALASGRSDMQADAAQLVRDMKSLRPDQSFTSCVIPLMAILKDEQAETNARILAALALDQLDSDRGNFAISRTAQFTDDARLRHLCTWLAYDRLTGKDSSEKGMAYIEPMEELDH